MTPRTDSSPPAWPGDTFDRLLSALQEYNSSVSEFYDEILFEVSERIAGNAGAGKSDVGSLLFWKRLRADTRWAMDLNCLPDSVVRDATARMYEAANDQSASIGESASAARRALSPLPGFRTGDAMASALILAAAPSRMAVYDKRAQLALDKLDIRLSAASGRYGRYMEIVEHIKAVAEKHGVSWTARDVDKALFQLGG